MSLPKLHTIIFLYHQIILQRNWKDDEESTLETKNTFNNKFVGCTRVGTRKYITNQHVVGRASNYFLGVVNIPLGCYTHIKIGKFCGKTVEIL